MKFQITAVLAGLAVASLTACGNGSDEPSGQITASEADSPKEVVAVYEAQIIRIADAVEKVDDDDSAREAARIIQEASAELEGLEAKVEGMSGPEKMQFAMAYATGLSDTHIRLATAMQRLAETDEEHWKMIAEAMDELPDPAD